MNNHSENLRNSGKTSILVLGEVTDVLREILNEFNVSMNITGHKVGDERFEIPGVKTFIELTGAPIADNAVNKMITAELEPKVDEIFNNVIMKRIRKNAEKGSCTMNVYNLGERKLRALVVKKIVNTDGLRVSFESYENDRFSGISSFIKISF